VSASVTIVIPTKDRAELLRRAIASAKAQTHSSVEIIVVDDGSATPVVPEPGVRYIRNDVSRGVSAARNQGLAAAAGEWIAFLDDDDELLPDFVGASLRRAVSSRLTRPVSVQSTIEVVDETGQVRDLRRPVSLKLGQSFFDADDGRPHFAFANSLFMPVAVLQGIGGWDERLRAWEVEDFFIRLSKVSSIDGIDEVWYRMHDHRGPRLGEDDGAMVAGALLTMRAHPGDFATHRGRQARYQAALATLYLRNGQAPQAVRALSLSFRLQPRFPRRPLAWLVAVKAFMIHAVAEAVDGVLDVADKF
jgi:hypothetical protein